MNDVRESGKDSREQEEVAEELHALEAHDPEGHGQDIRVTVTSVLIGLSGLVLVIALATGIAWAVSGGEAARLVLGGSAVVVVLLVLPFGGVLVLRSNTHRDLEREAERLQDAPGDASRDRSGRKWSRIRKFRRAEQESTVEAKQRMDGEGGPVPGVPQVQDR